MNKRPGGALRKSSDTASNSQLLPIVSKGCELTQKAFLVPAAITMLFIVGLFSSVDKPDMFRPLLAAFIILAGYYVIYRLCGKAKHWWVLSGVALFTAIALATPLLSLFMFFFRRVLPGELSKSDGQGFISLFVHMFFGAGLMEELFKAMPVLILAWLVGRLSQPWRERIGVTEPLDGILFGAASGAGFTLVETLGQYVPEIANAVAAENGELAGDLVGLQLLIPRIAASVFGHMAYSGYFGYFIGLAVLRPDSRWLVLGIGYLSASATHALWNSAAAIGWPLQVAAGILAYALLTAAILKARQISPSRNDNFASRVISPGVVKLAFYLDIGNTQVKLFAGTIIRQSDVPGLATGAAHGMLAVVDHSPNDPSVLGLKNLSSAPWNVAMADGSAKAVASGKSIRLTADSLIDFGGVRCRVRQLLG